MYKRYCQSDSIFYSTKNQVRGLCLGGDTVILFFSDPAVFTQTLNYDRIMNLSEGNLTDGSPFSSYDDFFNDMLFDSMASIPDLDKAQIGFLVFCLV